jgi:hypothetical protein
VDTPYFYLMDGDMRLREDFLPPRSPISKPIPAVPAWVER